MSRKILMAVAAFGLSFVLAGTGSAIAGEKGSPEFGTWQYWEAVEAGTLPSPAGSSVVKGPERSEKEKLLVIELGGVPFRVGLDTY